MSRLNKKQIKELSELFNKWGYTFDVFFPEVDYNGPRGGSDNFLINDFFREVSDDLMNYEYYKIHGKWGDWVTNKMKPVYFDDWFDLNNGKLTLKKKIE